MLDEALFGDGEENLHAQHLLPYILYNLRLSNLRTITQISISASLHLIYQIALMSGGLWIDSVILSKSQC